MSCTSTGRIDQTPELRQGPKVQWCHFQLVKKSKGKTYYETVKVFGERAQKICERYRAGDLVTAEGHHKLEEWEYQGKTHHRLVLMASDILSYPDACAESAGLQPGDLAECGPNEPSGPPVASKKETTQSDDIPF